MYSTRFVSPQTDRRRTRPSDERCFGRVSRIAPRVHRDAYNECRGSLEPLARGRHRHIVRRPRDLPLADPVGSETFPRIHGTTAPARTIACASDHLGSRGIRAYWCGRRHLSKSLANSVGCPVSTVLAMTVRGRQLPTPKTAGSRVGIPSEVLVRVIQVFRLSKLMSNMWNRMMTTIHDREQPVDDRLVGSDRVLAVLVELAKYPEGVNLDEVSRVVRSPKPTVHRALASLCRAGLAAKDGRGRYLLGDEFLRLAYANHELRPDHVRVQPILDRLASRYGETAHYAVLDGPDIVYRSKVDPVVGAMRLTSTIGGRNPAHSTAVGKILLAHRLYNLAAVEAWVGDRPLSRKTSRTVSTPAELHAQLQLVRERGYGVDDQESEAGRQLHRPSGLSHLAKGAERCHQYQRAGVPDPNTYPRERVVGHPRDHRGALRRGRVVTVRRAVRATSNRLVLAEGPVWMAGTSQIAWIDIEAGKVFKGRLDGDRVQQTHQFDFDGKVGAAVDGDDGSLLVAADNRLIVIAPDGRRREGPFLFKGTAARANDGAVDPAGRLLIGTYHFDERPGEDTLQRLELDGTLTVIDDDLSISNGLAWAPDGTLFYSADTANGIIWVRDYDAHSGTYGSRREHLQTTGGYPDGIAVDTRGHLWVAIWGGAAVRSFGPDGTPGDVVELPVPHVSSVAFVGHGLDRLLITTSSRDLDAAGLARHPDAGCLFLADVGVSGTPTTPWNSSALIEV